jgi:hypothetical protein
MIQAEIENAVKVAGASDSRHATARHFVRGFTAVLIRAKRRDVPRYVTVAVKMRADLAREIAVAALRAQGRGEEEGPASCGTVSKIIAAAVAARPEAATEIVQAAIVLDPQFRQCINSALILAGPDEKDANLQAANSATQPFAFLTFSMAGYTGFPYSAATLNPANISAPEDDRTVNSPEQPPRR